MPNQNLEDTFNTTLTTIIEGKISDIVEDIRDFKDQSKTSRNQLAYLLCQEAEKQHSDAACKIMVKNCWQYVESDENYALLREHRENMINWAAQVAGIDEKDIRHFHFDHRRGKSISPFTMVNVGNFYTKQKLMEWYAQNFDKKGITEWTNEKLSHLTNGNNKAEANGMIKVEPCIAAFDRMQTEPLKAMMAVITKLAPNLKWRHSWKHLTLQNPETEEYIAWLALDHLQGIAKVYLDRRLFTARQFEDEFHAVLGAQMTKKAVGAKGKGKSKGGEGVLTPEDFLKAVGLGTDGEGSYYKVSTLSMKTKMPFTFEIRCINQEEFATKYTEHLNRIAKRILQPDLLL